MPTNLLTELAKPFHPSVVHWVPAEISNDKSTALATTEIDIRHYLERLDKAAGMGWSVAYTPWGDRIICHLTIDGVTRSSVGESAGDQWAEVVAFKRACGMFGLGRYLDNMPVMWVPYDANSKTLEELSRSRLHGIITQHYQRFLDEQPTPATQEPQPATVPAETPTAVSAESMAFLDELGVELYGDQWPTVKLHNIMRLVGDGGAGALTDADVQTLINGLKRLKKSRQ